MSYPTMDEISWKFTGKPWALNSYPLTPDEVWAKLDLGAEEVRTALNTLSTLLGSTSEDNWLYQQIANAILDQVADGSLTDVKLSDTTGQIKDRLTTQINQNTWVKIAEQALSETAAQIDFASIPSGYKNFRLTYDAIKSTVDQAAIHLILNDDVGANYRQQVSLFNSTTPSTSGLVAATKFSLTNGLASSGQIFSHGTLEISNFNQLKAKVISGEWYTELGTENTSLLKYMAGGVWANVSDEIAKISLKTGSGLFEVGSSFALWGCR